jgi:hypothetical protein
LLIEPEAQNKCLQSEDITTGWNVTDATGTADATTAPDGNTTAYELTATGSGPRIYQTISVSAVKHTVSVFLKGNGLDFVRIYASGTGINAFRFYGLSGSGTVGSGGGAVDNATIEAYPNGWYRCTLTWTQSAAGTVTFLINGAQSISDVTVDPTGSPSIYIWGLQFETGPIATSYMPTTISPFTRGKDEATMTNVSGLIGQKEGTLYVEVDWRLRAGTGQELISVSDGTINNRFIIYNELSNVELRMFVTAGGSIKVNQGVDSSGFSGIQKIALAYADGDQELYRNGSPISTAAGSLAALATLTDIDLGQNAEANYQANMWIRSVQIIPRRLSDEQLIELTS